MDSPTSEKKAPLYQGKELPLGSLSPSEFEDFVFACLLEIGGDFDLVIEGMPHGAGDGGFDVKGKNSKTGRTVCVQCKRKKEPLDTPLIALELAKVAATAHLNGYDVGEHRFICTGGIRKKLRKELTEASRQTLASEAGRQLETSSDLAELRKSLVDQGADPRLIAESYVYRLDQLMAWGTEEFNVSLSSRWNDVLRIAERFFQIATVVREFPRAVFDRNAYIAEHCHFNAILEPRLAHANLPEGISANSLAAPNTQLASESQNRRFNQLHDLLALDNGELLLLLGNGGVGKTTSLFLLRAEVLRSASDSTLPVLISLANYLPNCLDSLIHQELGVDSGTWKSLPDRVMLLCDGLNECSSDHVAAFLAELKPLLKRGKLACVLSTRETAKHRNVLLPQAPVACLKLEGITPIAIRKLANKMLGLAAADAFVAAYRALADTAWTEHLWTAFAVNAALQLWQKESRVPATLGEMLKALLRQQCERNEEAIVSSTMPDVVLKLAGSLAFQSLIIEKRLACPVAEAGRWIRQAKLRCADVFGVADMNDEEVISLLTRHELVHLSASGHYGFKHQLLAGALAAPILADEWERHTASIGESVADDAWIFAAPLVSETLLASYLEALFNVDVMLGARAGRELPSQFQAIAEQCLFRAVDASAPTELRFRALFGLGGLGSTAAIAKLQQLVSETQRLISYNAQRALAMAGDLDLLKRILPEVEAMWAVPGQISGGNIALWQEGPLPIRLDLARQYLSVCSPGQAVNTSLQLVAYERDPDDAGLIEQHVVAALDVKARKIGFYALNQVSPKRAKALFADMLAQTSDIRDRASLMLNAWVAKIHFDIQLAFDCAIAELPNEKAESEYFSTLIKLIGSVIEGAPLPPNMVETVERELPNSRGDRKLRLWQVALSCKSTFITDYALACIAEWGREFGSACDYLVKQPALATIHRDKLLALCTIRLKKNTETWHDWNCWQALTLVGELGFDESTAESLSLMIQELVKLSNEEKRLKAIAAPANSSLPSAATESPLKVDILVAAAIIIPAAAKAQALLSNTVRLSLLYLDYQNLQGVIESMSQVLAGLNQDEVDAVLMALDDANLRRAGLVAACACGVTDIRLALLREDLTSNYAIPYILKFLSRAFASCWCTSTCKVVVDVVAEIPIWHEYETQFFGSFYREIAQHLEPENLLAIEEALAIAQTPFAKQILQSWHDQITSARIGLSRLPVHYRDHNNPPDGSN